MKSPGKTLTTRPWISGRCPLVLASGSPRRAEILERLGIPFVIEVSGVEERRRSKESPRAFAQRAAADKGSEVLRRMGSRRGSPWVLGADTIVVLGDEILGKPKHEKNARRMLAALSGKTHEVITGVWIGRWAKGESKDSNRQGEVSRKLGGIPHPAGLSEVNTLIEYLSDVVVTEVTFRKLNPRDITAYLASREWKAKAGAYAIQGLGAGLVSSIHGDYYNVMGLPGFRVVEMLIEVGAIKRYPI